MHVLSASQKFALAGMALAFWLALPVPAEASKFSMPSDIFASELGVVQVQPGIQLEKLIRFPALNLAQLLEVARGKLLLTKPRLKILPLKSAGSVLPKVYVAGPVTKGILKQVAVKLSMADESDELALMRQAQEALNPMQQPRTSAKHAINSEKFSGEGLRLSEQLSFGEKTLVSRELEISEHKGELRVTPKSLKLSLQNQIRAVMGANLSEVPQMFLRNPSLATWDSRKKLLEAREAGKTELYITYKGRLHIVPIEISSAGLDFPLQGLGSLQDLTSIMPLAPRQYASFDSVTSSRQADIPPGPSDSDNSVADTRSKLSLATSIAQVDATATNQAEKRSQFFYPDASPRYKTVDIQVVDERTSVELGEVFPVSGVTVRVVGTRLQAKTDAKGHARFGEIPEGSRLVVQIQDDQRGMIIPTTSELALYRDAEDEVLRARTMSYRAFSAYLNIAELAQDVNKASLCARVMSADGRQALSGYQVGLNVEADGPYYIGRFGPQRDLDRTDSSGRFCYFNIKPGLAELSFYQGNQLLTALALPIFPGAHTEEDLPLRADRGGRLFLAAMPSAVDQLYEEQQATSNAFEPVDYADVVMVGENKSFLKNRDSVLAYDAGASLFKGRLYALTQAPEFEPSLSSYDRDKEIGRSYQVLPLLQRGYVQDIYHELATQDGRSSIAFDPALGTVLVMSKGEGSQPVQVSLTDLYGRVFDQGWSFGGLEESLNRTIFFNLDPGLYVAKVETMQGSLLSLDSVAVDFWTTSIVQMGVSAHFTPVRARREDDPSP